MKVRDKCFIRHRDFGPQQRHARFCGRLVVLSILCVFLYPFLWAWTVIGSLWFFNSRDCVCILLSLVISVFTIFWEIIVDQDYVHVKPLQLPEQGQKWGFLIWLLFSCCGLICLAGWSIKSV